MISKNAKGLTLVEILIAMMLLSFIVVVGNRVMLMFAKAGSQNLTDYNLQNTARVSASTMKTSINNASTLFLITESAFKPGKLTEEWHYVGVERVGDCDEVVQYIYNETKKTHDRIVLGRGLEGCYIELSFKKLEMDDRKVVVTFTNVDKNGKKSVLIDTTFETMNTHNLVDWTSGAGAKAYAYRTEVNEILVTKAREPQLALIGFTIDRSGSMRWGMSDNNKTPNRENRPKEETRTYILREALYNFVTSMKNNEYTYITSNTFGDYVGKSVRQPRHLANTTEYGQLLTMFSPIKYDNYLAASGDTNAGDGLRVLYYQMQPGFSPHYDGGYWDPGGTANNHTNNTLADAKRIYILVSDGDNNMVTFMGNRGELDDYSTVYKGPAAVIPSQRLNSESYTGYGANVVPNNPTIPAVIGWDTNLQKIHGNEYCYIMAAHVKNIERDDTEFYAIAMDDVFFFGRLAEIWGYGAPGTPGYEKYIFKAQDVESVKNAFVSVSESIKLDLSYLQGPDR